MYFAEASRSIFSPGDRVSEETGAPRFVTLMLSGEVITLTKAEAGGREPALKVTLPKAALLPAVNAA